MASNICKNCGNSLSDGEIFCGECGTHAEPSIDDDTSTPVKKCKVCDDELAADMEFCGNCGTPAGSVKQPTKIVPDAEMIKPKTDVINKNLNIKKFIISAIAAALFIIIGITAYVLFTPSKYIEAKGYMQVYSMEDGVAVILDGKNPVILDGKLIWRVNSLDRTKAALLIDEGLGENYVLYYISDKIQQVSDDVLNANISMSGDSIAFTRDYDSRTRTAELCLYTGGRISVINTDYYEQNGMVISPDGKSIAYTVLDGDIYGYYWDGKSNQLGKDIIPKGIANGGKYIYYDRNDTFFVQKGTNSETRIRLGDRVRTVLFNRDLSQVIYTADNKTYISRKGEQRESLSGIINRLVLPSNASLSYLNRGLSSSYDDIRTYSVSTFANTFYIDNNDTLIRINNKFETSNVIRSISSVFLADNGKTVLYLRNGSIFKINGLKENNEPERIVDRNVNMFQATSDGKAVYFINGDSEFFYQKGTSRPVMVSNDFQRNYNRWGSNIIMNGLFKGNTIFFIDDGELYTSSGKKGTLVRGLDDDVESITINKYAVVVTCKDRNEYSLYYSLDGSKFIRIGIL